MDLDQKTIAFIFARWIITCYDSDILMRKDGQWWRSELIYFEKNILPTIITNGAYQDMVEFLNKSS